MKRLFLTLMVFSLQSSLFITHLQGNEGYRKRCFVWSCPEGLGFDVSALIWRNCRNNYVYAFNLENIGTNNEVDNFSQIMPSYSGGVRGKLSYHPNNCMFYSAEYSYFSSHDKDTTYSPVYAPYFISPASITVPEAVNEVNFVTFELKNQYQRVRALGAIYLMNTCCFNFYTFGGLGWLHLRESNNQNAFAPEVEDPARAPLSLFTKMDMFFNGGTVEVGVGGKYYFSKCLGIGGEFNGLAAIGEREYRFRYTDLLETNSLLIKNRLKDVNVCVPGLDIRLELFFTSNWCFSLPLTLAVGYEYHSFFNILFGNPTFAPFATQGIRIAQMQENIDVSYGGPYINLGVCF